jgi:hypothetical protein
MKRPTREQARARVFVAEQLISALRALPPCACLPGTRRKLASALKSAEGALRNARRFAQ